jgi:hypothetical protein
LATIADQTDQSGQTDVNAPKAVGSTGGGGAGFATTTGGGTGKEAPGGYGGVAPGSQSGSFQNVNAILNANKQSNIAGGIVNNYSNQAGQFNQGVGQQENQATGAINQQWNAATGGTGGTEQQAAQNVQNLVQGTANAGQAGSGWTTNAQGNLTDQNAVNQFQAALNTQYQAPNVNWSNQQQQLQNFQQAGQNAQSATGQTALLQQQYGSPSYTQGQQSIDQLLLQNNPQEQHNLGQLQQIAGSAAGTLGNAQNQVTTAGQTTQNNINQLNQAAQGALQGAIGTQGSIAVNPSTGTATAGFTPAALTGTAGGGLLGTLASQATNEAVNTQNAYNQTQQAIQNNQWTPGLLQAAGLTSGQSAYGLTNTPAGLSTLASDILGPSAAQLTPGLSGTMTAQQAAQANALESLAGNNSLGATLQQALGQSANTQAQAGGVQAYNPTFNTGNLQSQLQFAQAALQGQATPLLSQIQGIAGMEQGAPNVGAAAAWQNPAVQAAVSAAAANPTNVGDLSSLAALLPGSYYNGVNVSEGSQQAALNSLLSQYGGSFSADQSAGGSQGYTLPNLKA